MADRAKHAFGMLENIDSALSNGTINAYDILFVKDANGKPYVGWIDKDGNKVICESEDVDLSGIEAEIANIESAMADKANAEEVDAKIAAALDEHLVKKYEIDDVPDGTLVDYSEKEIRVMCKDGAIFTKQNVGTGGDPNTYYMTFKTYCPDNAVGYKEHLGDQVDEEILTDLKTDEYGRKYQPTWLGLAKYDEVSDTWTYYGANSSMEKYIGWDYQIDWYDANGVMIASDCVRINLSNESCHYSTKPYYVGGMMKEIETMVDKKVAEVDSAYEIIEF
jgi:hypothetical protein